MKNTDHYKTVLLAEKQTLEEELGGIALFNTETNIWEATPDQELMGEIDDNDAADRFEDFEGRSGMVTTLQTRLTDVNAALEKIENGTFGICEVSGEKIEEDRLNANPAARTSKAHMND
ncbi:MAG TPA: TraR/DksA C4-type zinc finger protein [Candidatus Paceibacterota bacterium]